MKNYLVSGGKIMSQLEALKMYIKAVERQILQAKPEPSGKQFSAIYPDASTMILATIRADKFSKELE